MKGYSIAGVMDDLHSIAKLQISYFQRERNRYGQQWKILLQCLNGYYVSMKFKVLIIRVVSCIYHS